MRSLYNRLRQSKTISTGSRILLTLVALWLVFKDIDLAHLGEIFANQNYWLVLTVPITILMQIGIVSFRWQYILYAIAPGNETKLTSRKLLNINYISSFFNCCLPGTVGADLVRVWLLKAEDFPVSTAIHSVIIDRLIALLALLLLSVVTLPLLDSVIGFHAEWLSPTLLALSIAGIWLLPYIDKKLAQYQKWRLVRWALYFSNSLCMMLKHRRASMVSLTYAVISHISFCVCVYALAQSLGLTMTLGQALALIPPVMLAMTLPISFGGWGVREASMVGMLGLIGVPQANALLLSIEIGLLTVVATLPAGVLWLTYTARARHPQSLKEITQ